MDRTIPTKLTDLFAATRPANSHTEIELLMIHQVQTTQCKSTGQEIEKITGQLTNLLLQIFQLDELALKTMLRGKIYDRLRMPSPNGWPDQHCIYRPKHSTSQIQEKLQLFLFLAAGAPCRSGRLLAHPQVQILSLLAKQSSFWEGMSKHTK